MTEVNIENVHVAQFQCDTAASHNVMSGGLYRKLRGQRPDRIPPMRQEKLAIRLADGSVGNKKCGSVQLPVKAKNSNVVVLNFFIMAGADNILGRLVLQKIWPAQ